MAKTLTVYLAADLKKFNSGMDQAGKKAQGLSGTMNKMLKPALIGAGVAAGAMATKFAADGVKAFLDDEAAASKLAKTLENLGQAHDTKPVEAYIYQLERSLGIADTELRPAYDRLVRSIGDTAEASRVMKIALDVSAGTGKSLESVVEALGKAYEGNITGLSRLGAGLDAATIRTGDMDEITQKLSETFAGQATTQADTYQGQLQRLETAVDNLAEAFGKGLVTALGDTADATDDAVTNLEKMEPLFQAVGDDAGKAATDLIDFGDKVLNTWEAWQYEARRADSVLIGLWQSISKTDDEAAALAAANRGLSDSFEYVQYAAYDTEGALDRTSTAAGIAGAALSEAGDDAAISGDQAAAAAKGYQNLYEGMADVAQLQRDLAGTSGTVVGALASGYLNPQTVPLMNKYNERSDRKNARREERRREREAEARRARLDSYDPPNTAVKDQDRDARAKARGVKTRTGGR